LDKWLQLSDGEHSSSAETTVVGFDSAIHNLIAKQTEQAVVKKPADSDDSERKRAILAQYGDVCEGDEYPWFYAFYLWTSNAAEAGDVLVASVCMCTKTDNYCSEVM